MTTDAISGVGTSFKRGDGTSNESFTAIAEINSISGPTMTRNFIDVTSLDSAGGYREFISSFRDAGTVQLNMNFTRDGWNDMLTDFGLSTSKNYQIVLPDSGETTLDFAAFVTDLPIDISEDKITCTITLKITGAVTLTS